MVIRDQGYTQFKGDLSSGSPAWWVVAQNGFGLHWQHLRSKLLLFPIFFLFILFALMTFGERVVTQTFLSGQGQPDDISGFYEYAFGYFQVWVVALYFASSACGVVAEDLRHKTIQLYFSKPLTRTDYVVGKFLSLFMFGGLVTLLPAALVATVRLLVFAPSEAFSDVALKMGGVMAFDVAMVALMSVMVLALSALTPRTGYVVLTWAGLMLVPSVVATVVDLVRRGEDWPDLLSVAGVLGVALQTLTGYKGLPQPGQLAPEPLPDYMTWASWSIIGVLAAAAIGVLYWRTSKLEGIA